ncbi:hypothetical protein M7I_0819 [Glarea lozoyensis 74030]|uniref:Nucleotide-binding, alpha-beta plait n=1 Tax=Glarea lozoyensis (strain ATCC 74030 / MF5533) TaxID=1104152 RepID=H0EEE4_GLAL7|nr:hypothetical protein M7I_0819 [Glarea lozoyensis 74030]
MATALDPVSATATYTRLHITPLDPSLLRAILPPSVLPSARNISYHTIATFPEKGYGFLDLPVMDAEKVKKKLNGAILKGSKIRIEKARPEKKLDVAVEEEPEAPKKQKKHSKKRKRTDDAIPGAEIGERSVKRGWTTPVATKLKDKEVDKKKIKSKYTTGPECLFKTVVPPNVASVSKITEKPDKKKRGKPGKETVVHEFSKTTKYPTFLKTTSSGKKAVSAEFVEGEGWVDEEGNVVDEVVKTTKKVVSLDKPKRKRKEATPEPVIEEESSSDESSSSEDSSEKEEVESEKVASPSVIEKKDSTSSESSSDEDSSLEEEPESEPSASAPGLEKEDSPSGESSSDGDSSEDEAEAQTAAPAVTSILKATPPTIPDTTKKEAESPTSSSSDSESDSDDSTDSSSDDDEADKDISMSIPESATDSRPISRPQSSSGPPINLSIKIPAPPTTTEIHPLEALYKRQKTGTETAPKPATESFSFFGTDDAQNESEAEEATDQVPLTPYTQRDFEYRGLRSAAPTPDTAHASKRFLWPSSRDDDEDDTPSSPIRGKAESSKEKGKEKAVAGNEKKEEESDFQKWFYEHRGDTNRAWKKRRRVAGKEKRHRENKKRTA